MSSNRLVNITYDNIRDTLDVQQSSSIQDNKEIEKQLAIDKLYRSIYVPTYKPLIQYQLRCLQQPITLYAENDYDRRDRLRRHIAELTYNGIDINNIINKDITIESFTQDNDITTSQNIKFDKPFLTEGTQELLQARQYILNYSLQQVKQRLANERNRIQQLIQNTSNNKSLLSSDKELLYTHKDMNSIIQQQGNTPQQLYTQQQQLHGQRYKKLNLTSTETGDNRPISAVSFCRNYTHNNNNTHNDIDNDNDNTDIYYTRNEYIYGSGSWSGDCKIWSMYNNQSKHTHTLRGHIDNITDIQWHPFSNTQQYSQFNVNIATCGFDTTVKLWPLKSQINNHDMPMLESSEQQANDDTNQMIQSNHISNNDNSTATTHSNNSSNKNVMYLKPLATLTGHKQRCSKLCYHSSGNYIFSTSYDCTWNMYDIDTQQCILHQYGHTRPTYGISCHIDGSLLCVSDMSSNSIIWDIRTGRPCINIIGHNKPVICNTFSNNGKLLVTGSADHSIKVWDLRKTIQQDINNHNYTTVSCLFTIPAHTHLVSSVNINSYNDVLISSSYDGSIKAWSLYDFSLLNTYTVGVNEKVMSIDISNDDKYILCGTYDRNIKLYTDD